MAINLSRYKDELIAAWKDVLDDKTSTDWTLFGYEKQTNDLMVVGKGDGGIEELAEELNSGKIMYAFCKVTDPNTGLPKCVLINWQGEGAPLARKGTCANHINDVVKFFKGAHVTMNARTEDDVESSIILEKVAKATSTCFNFKDRSEPEENVGPVGTTYRRIHPDREINSTEREKFWLKEQEEENRRIQEEKKRAEEARLKLEHERQEREAKETRAREEWVKERTRSINEMREAERNAENAARSADLEKKQWEKQLQEDVQEEQARRARSESLRKERSLEAQTLISQRTINARAVFEQNTCTGQMSSMKYRSSSQVSQEYPDNQSEYISSYQQSSPEKITPPLSPPAEYKTPDAPSEQLPAKEKVFQESQNTSTSQTKVTSGVPQDFSYTRNLLKEGLPPRQESELETNPEEEQNWDEPTLEAPPEVKDPLTELMVEHGMSAPQSAQQSPQIITSGSVGQGLRARALYDYQAADETEISFDPEDIIIHIEQIDAGWWQGMAPDGSYGLFPANYVELID